MSELSDNVVSIAKAREQRSSPKATDRYLFTLHVYDGGADGDYGCISGLNEEMDGDELRDAAGRLECLARIMRDQAEDIDPDEDGFILGRVTVWESSRVRCWTSDRVATDEQIAWLHDRLDDAKDCITPLPAKTEKQNESA